MKFAKHAWALACSALLSTGLCLATASSGTLPLTNAAHVALSNKHFRQGELLPTGNDLDLAIVGPGYFKIHSAAGLELYTRDGTFHLDATGTLVTSEGCPLQPPVIVPLDTVSVIISEAGEVSALRSEVLLPERIGTISLFRFLMPDSLKNCRGNRHAQTLGSGEAQPCAPGVAGTGTLHQGFAERQKVQVFDELFLLLLAQCSHEINKGSIRLTGKDLDLAIVGPGFFKVKTGDGEDCYTRDGRFRLDGTGTLVTCAGYPLQPPVLVPPDSFQVVIDESGLVWVMKSNDRLPQSIGAISLFRFPDSRGLRAQGSNLLAETLRSGAAQPCAPGTAGTGSLHQGAVERSAAQVLVELFERLVEQRHWEIKTSRRFDCPEMDARNTNTAVESHDTVSLDFGFSHTQGTTR